MATLLEKLKKTRFPGVFRLPDGRLLAKVSVRMPGGKVVVRKHVMAVGATEAETVGMVAELREAVRNPPEPTPTLPLRDTSQTVEQYCVRWLEVRAKRLSPSTAQTYAWCINDRILPRLGHLPCAHVTRQVIESWVVWAEAQVQPRTGSLTKNGKTTRFRNPHGGQRYRQETMRQWWRCLHTLLGDMAADLDIADPTRRVRPPARPELPPVREQRTLNADGTGDLLVAARQHFPKHYPVIAVMAMCGMRAGEVFGLRWDVIDFDNATITVRRAISRGELRERTKTGSQRVVPMHKELAETLQALRRGQVAAQDKGLADGLVFPGKDGKPRNPCNMKKVWVALRETCGTSVRVGPQVLRRSLNTQLVLAGVDRITTRAILGHTSEAMTQRYAGVNLADVRI
ncbi:MAG: tyrosine-type recombinase/integrase, partial [Myxococcota bacterium]